MNLPNKLTIARIALSPVFMALILIDDTRAKLASLVVFVIAALTDLGDGYFARRSGRITGFGKFMDPLADKILASTALISLVALGYVRGWMVIVIVAREFLITGVRSMAAYRGMLIVPSFWARIKTALQMLTISVILLFVYLKAMLVPLGYHWAIFESQRTIFVFDVLMGITMVITVATGVDYLVRHAALLKNVIR
ncbi:MAG: CDP-diacylglycerol--glycerol-3-phosphate 3-phosphatidyltransferase [candidate division Zixibacteria bacterium]|nr:CDP-diacylglycerol--glycerol-3-phosphate 3-phosphatidyltransferase [candidate division Zixibacteria bacterium]